MPRPLRAAALVTLLAALLAAVLPPAAGPAGATGVLDALRDPLAPPAAGGAARVDRLLAKLATHRRLLVVGAHPDDEDTTLLAYVVQGLGGEAAYLSLSRGEGGQNLIGSELGVGLGLLRSRELLAARSIDGARQYFTRAYDFGYTRSIEETLERWPREALLEDAVRVIRRFKPQVVVAVFPPDERAGHGQHQASGIVAREAFDAAGHPEFLPVEAQRGTYTLWPEPPWRPQAFYRAAWWRPEAATVTFPLGLLEPVSGRSIFQIAMASRSQHRCQDMGMLQPLGPFEGRLAWEAGAGEEGGDVFAGIDTSLAAMAAVLGESGFRDEIARELAAVEELARTARAAANPAAPRAALPAAAEIHRRLVALRHRFPKQVDSYRSPESTAFLALLGEKIDLAEELVMAAAGLGLDAWADRETLVPGSEAAVEAAVWDAAGSGIELLEVDLIHPLGFRAEAAAPPERDGSAARFQGGGDRPDEGYHLRAFRVTVPADAAPTVPYFLERPLAGDLYDWGGAEGEVKGEPFGRPPLHARFRLKVAGEEIQPWREVVHRYRDQALGEVRRPLRVVPELEIAAGRDLVVWPIAAGAPRELEVVLTSHAARPLAGRVEARVPPGWPEPAPAAFELAAAGARESVRLTLTPPSPFPPGGYEIALAAVVGNGSEAGGAAVGSEAAGIVLGENDAGGFGAGEAGAGEAAAGGGAGERRLDLAVPLVDYPHIRPTPWPERAAVRVTAADLVLPALERVGYVRGASDVVPEALADVGVPLEILTPATLAAGDLARFDAIVVGTRAYETEPALAEANPRLLDYGRRGGLVIVQYQQYPFVAGGYAPYPLEIARPHGRVTDETAPVTVLEPNHPAFTTPNPIGAADWDGWVQERGLYMPASWGEPFRPLLETADPGGEPQRGALLVAPLGEGTYVYTGLAFFRQLPAGVPGAYRLFANLLALARPVGGGGAGGPEPERGR